MSRKFPSSSSLDPKESNTELALSLSLFALLSVTDWSYCCRWLLACPIEPQPSGGRVRERLYAQAQTQRRANELALSLFRRLLFRAVSQARAHIPKHTLNQLTCPLASGTIRKQSSRFRPSVRSKERANNNNNNTGAHTTELNQQTASTLCWRLPFGFGPTCKGHRSHRSAPTATNCK